MQTAASKPVYRRRWWTPVVALVLGLAMLVAFWIGDNVTEGLISFGVMAAVAVGVVVFGRSETVSGLSGPGRDGRWEKIDIHATALTGSVLITVIIGAFLVDIASGGAGNPYGLLGAVAGITYIVAVAVLRARS
jgi:cobalamin synthase